MTTLCGRRLSLDQPIADAVNPVWLCQTCEACIRRSVAA